MSREALEAAKFAKILAQHGLSDDGFNDVFIATATAETFRGNAGNDTVSYHQSTSGVTVGISADGAGASQGGFAAGDDVINMENVIGSQFGDKIYGDLNANTLVGLGGNDEIYGNGGSDRLFGDAGLDQLFAFGASNTQVMMDGGADADLIKFTTNGGQADIITGEGKDQVTIRVSSSDTFHVVIEDFQPYFETASGNVTFTESLNGDRLRLEFRDVLGTDVQQLARFTQEINGDDLILHFTDPHVHGDIEFVGIGQHLDIHDFAFRIDLGFYSNPMPV
jgi:Ca2+-binding RTX toxin-like protein